VVEFPRSELREIGLKWGAIGGATVGAIWAPIRRGSDGPYNVNIPATQSGLPITGADGTQAVRLPSALNILGGINLGLNAQLNLLEQSGQASVLAEPQLSARNGAKASFLAGGEFPYSVSNLTGTTIIFRSYGIKLDISPKVDRNSVIRATIQAEISSIDASVSTAGGPALLSRKIDTEFNVRSGETIVLAGLLQRNTSNDIDKVPMLGDVPVLGALFRSKRFQNKETELVIFVTPTVVDSHSPGLVDRVERTTERLQQQMGRQPYLSNPLQPNTDASDFNRVPPNRSKPVSLSTSPVNTAPAVQAAAPVVLVSPTTSAVATLRPAADPAKVPAAVIPVTAIAAAPIESVPGVPAIQASGSSAVATTLEPKPAIPPVSRNVGKILLQINVESTSMRAAPDSRSPVLLQLGRGAVVQLSDRPGPHQSMNFWRAVSVGSVEGWVASSAVTPLKLETIVVPNPNTDLSLVASQGRMVGMHSIASSALPKTSTAVTTGVATATSGSFAVSSATSRYRVLLDGLALRVAPDVNALTVAKLDVGLIVEGAPDQAQGYWTAIKLEGKQGWVATQWLVPQGAPLQK
jgi:pilus assembly protein CpaC